MAAARRRHGVGLEPPRRRHARREGGVEARRRRECSAAKRGTLFHGRRSARDGGRHPKKAFLSAEEVMHAPISKTKRTPGCLEMVSANHSLPTWPSLRTSRPRGGVVRGIVDDARRSSMRSARRYRNLRPRAQAAVAMGDVLFLGPSQRVTANIKAPETASRAPPSLANLSPCLWHCHLFLPIAHRMPLILPATFSIAPITAENPTPDGLNRHRALKARDNELANPPA